MCSLSTCWLPGTRHASGAAEDGEAQSHGAACPRRGTQGSRPRGRLGPGQHAPGRPPVRPSRHLPHLPLSVPAAPASPASSPRDPFLLPPPPALAPHGPHGPRGKGRPHAAPSAPPPPQPYSASRRRGCACLAYAESHAPRGLLCPASSPSSVLRVPHASSACAGASPLVRGDPAPRRGQTTERPFVGRGTLGSPPPAAAVNSAAVTFIRVPPFRSFGRVPGGGIVGSCGNSVQHVEELPNYFPI